MEPVQTSPETNAETTLGQVTYGPNSQLLMHADMFAGLVSEHASSPFLSQGGSGSQSTEPARDTRDVSPTRQSGSNNTYDSSSVNYPSENDETLGYGFPSFNQENIYDAISSTYESDFVQGQWNLTPVASDYLGSSAHQLSLSSNDHGLGVPPFSLLDMLGLSGTSLQSYPQQDDARRSSPVTSSVMPFTVRQNTIRKESKTSTGLATPSPASSNGLPNNVQTQPQLFDITPAQSSKAPSLSPQSLNGHSPLYWQLPSDEKIIDTLRNYPKLMLDREYYPPFVHPSFYRCSEGGVAEPLAIALCCVSAYSNTTRTSTTFVENMVNTERGRLINDFHSQPSWIESLASLHAMCVYQILELFEVSNPKETKPRIKQAELHHHFLLKMAHQFSKKYLSANAMIKNDYSSWESWRTAESVRRTFFFINAINTLAYRSHALNPNYYEPFDEDTVFNMPLPAADVLWKATTEDRWKTERDNLSGGGMDTFKISMIDKLTDERLFISRNGESFDFNEPEEFTKLIIASAKPGLRRI